MHLVLRHRPPPRIFWITRGNSADTRLRELLSTHWAMVAAYRAVRISGNPFAGNVRASRIPIAEIAKSGTSRPR